MNSSIDMKEVKLAPGVVAFMHEQTGWDNLVALSFTAKLDTTDLEELEAIHLYKTRFGFCMSQTERLEGIGFYLPTKDSSVAEVNQCFRDWLTLPGEVFLSWFESVNHLKGIYNNPALLPPDRVNTEEVNKDPLPPRSEKRKGKE